MSFPDTAMEVPHIMAAHYDDMLSMSPDGKSRRRASTTERSVPLLWRADAAAAAEDARGRPNLSHSAAHSAAAHADPRHHYSPRGPTAPFPALPSRVSDAALTARLAAYLARYLAARAGLSDLGSDSDSGSSGGVGLGVGVGGESPAALLGAYVARVAKHTRLEPAAMALAVVYMERILARHEGLTLSAINASRMALVAMMLAAKAITDTPYSNKWWAKVSGEFTLEDLGAMEVEFISLLGWENLHVEEDEYLAHQRRALTATL
eukprot:TRINITY_DN313_c0_g3_i1.p1 TRINITY_DN313_c0_g3~~TRINITY_DN313_c0_g3_i1.p1  ORF type:complete len:264 (-),score=87.19 TRINITY_DN313_c0_g3_i1:277-1068(-)